MACLKCLKMFSDIEKDVDTSGFLTLDYKNFKCTLVGAKDCKAPHSISIQGDKGYLFSSDSPNILEEVKLVLNNGEERVSRIGQNVNRMYYEIEEFVRVVAKDVNSVIRKYNENTLSVMKVITKVKEFS